MPRSSILSLALVLGLANCKPATAPRSQEVVAPLTVPVRTTAKVDLLFMMDNSPSMDAMQTELRKHFVDLLAQLSRSLQGHTLDLQIGVVTSDYGAGAVPDPTGGCDASPGGQLGHLQAIGAAADPSCQAPAGVPFIRYRVANDGTITSNLPAGQDLPATFNCMASVGSAGCGFEHQLESVLAALRDTSFNAGFVRDDAQLVVVFVTNEDDGSAPPSAMFYSPDPAGALQYGALDTFRQTRFGIGCGLPPMAPSMPSIGPLANCGPAPSSLDGEYDVGRYIDLFTQPRAHGGLKDDPRDVILAAVMPPTTSFEVLAVANGSGNGKGPYPGTAAYQPCPPPGTVDGKSCLVRLQHACQNHVEPGFFGDPPLRLASVIEKAPLHHIANICGDDLDATPNFGSTMQGVGQAITTQIDGGCIGGALAENGLPSCTVTVSGSSLPLCGSATGGACWSVSNDLRCPSVADAGGKPSAPRLTLHGVSDGEIVSASCQVRTVE